MNTKSALILVDLQNDFMPGGALAVAKGDELVAIANVLMENKGTEKFDIIVATQDWHPAEHKSFAANHLGAKVYDLIDLNGIPQVLWPVHCVQNTFGAELHKDLNVDKITKIFYKGTNPEVDSYSGFQDNDKKSQTGLAKYLKENNVGTVFVMGLATDYCVKATALDALENGFETILLAHASKAVNINPTDEATAINDVLEAGGFIANTTKPEENVQKPAPDVE